MTFLIVDDQVIIREALTLQLGTLYKGSLVREAASGKECLKILQTFKPDIIFIDISMPEMNGIEVTLKALALYPLQKIIAFSMNDNREMLNKSLKAGVQGYLLKTDDLKDYKVAVDTVYSGQVFISKNMMNN
ncbi:MAG TPA: response regulator transcription factor [Mucilaginibacter sp.]|nr:response regulator transcription factor [Mucilaginibacter sp.]